jgi:hypothetical protein
MKKSPTSDGSTERTATAESIFDDGRPTMTMETAREVVRSPGAWERYRANMYPFIAKYAGGRADDFLLDVKAIAEHGVSLSDLQAKKQADVDACFRDLQAADRRYKAAVESMKIEVSQALGSHNAAVEAKKRTYFDDPDAFHILFHQGQVANIDTLLANRERVENMVKETDEQGKVLAGMLKYMESQPGVWEVQKDNIRRRIEFIVDEKMREFRDKRQQYICHLTGGPLPSVLAPLLLQVRPATETEAPQRTMKRTFDDAMEEPVQATLPAALPVRNANAKPISVEVAKKMAARRSQLHTGKLFGRAHPIDRPCRCNSCIAGNIHGSSDQFNYTWTVVDTQGLFDERNPKSSGVWKVFANPCKAYQGVVFAPQQAFEAAGCDELDVYKYKDSNAEQHNHFIFVPKQISCGDKSNTEFIPQDIFPGFVYSGVTQWKRSGLVNKRLRGGKQAHLDLFGTPGYKGRLPERYIDGVPIYNQLYYIYLQV